MRFPSLLLVASEAAAVWRRFPVVVSLAVVAAAAAIVATEDTDNQDIFLRLLYAASIGLPLAVALTIYPAQRGWTKLPRLALHLLGVAALVLFFFAWPHWTEQIAFRRYFQLSIGFHLLVAFVPFMGTGELNGFWQFNKTLFIRFLLSVLYAYILFGGLAIAILALDKLFGLDVDDELYFQLWILIGIVFTTFFFLGGIPADLKGLNALSAYPKGLRVFSQFILLPLVVVYLVILTLYMGKIAITQVWPSGWIGYLVSSVAVAGILVLLLVFPIREHKEHNWVRTYSRLFFIVLLPSVAMLLMALFKRIDQYGLTENRYFMVVLAFWLAVIALYFILSRAKNIKVIPTTLCVLAFATFLGPWGPYQLSARSQSQRLEQMFMAHDMVVEGKIQATTTEVSFEDRREMSAVLTYLLETHGTDPIAHWFEDGLVEADTAGDSEDRGSSRGKAGLAAKQVMKDLGLVYVDKWEREDRKHFNYWRPEPNLAVTISEYDFSFAIDNMHNARVVLDGEAYDLEYEKESISLAFKKGEEVLIRIPLQEVIEGAHTGGRSKITGEPEPMVVQVKNQRLAMMVQVRSLNGIETDDGPELNGLSGVFFVRF